MIEMNTRISYPQIIQLSAEVINNVRIQNYHEASMLYRKILSEYEQFLVCDGKFEDLLLLMYEALEKNDFILLADLLEEGFVPLLKDTVCDDTKEERKVNSEKYMLEATSTGYKTIKHIATGLYLHSNVNPMEEARVLVERTFDSSKREYAVWGVGLGYHILKLYEKSLGALKINVFEEDEELIHLAYEHGVLSTIPESILSCEKDPTGKKFAQYINSHSVGLLLHFPSVKKIEDSKIKGVMYNFFANWNGTIHNKDILNINFAKNTQNCEHHVDELRNKFVGKQVVIVGGGPSLDYNIDFLKECGDQFVVVAASTVWSKLLKLQIYPDVVFAMDPQQRTIGHMNEVNDNSSILVVDSTAYWEFAEVYDGAKYLACQVGFEQSEKLAREKEVLLFETGGTVVAFALDVALKLGAISVFFVGVDLAYPEGKSHMKGAMDYRQIDTELLHPVTAQDGTVTYTDLLFDMYREDIEKKIKLFPHVAFYNKSIKGAKIEGCKLAVCYNN